MEKPIIRITIDGERMIFSSEIGNEARISLLSLLINFALEVLPSAIEKEERKKKSRNKLKIIQKERKKAVCLFVCFHKQHDPGYLKL